jgi:hypothetical protein
MAEVVNRTVNVFINTGEAQKSYDKLIAKEKQLNDQLKQTSDPKQIQKLNAELVKLQEPITRATKKLSGELGPSMKDLQKLVRDLGNQFSHMSTKDADFSKVLQQYRQAQVELKGMKSLANDFEHTKKSGFGGQVLDFAKGQLLASGIMDVGGMVKDFFAGSVEEALHANDATEKFKSTLENLGRSDAFGRITHQADAIAEKFKYLDNDDVVGVFNKLVDYGRLTEQQMNQLVPVIVNFAAKTKQPIQDAAETIIKALSGNGKALKQFGIDLKAGSSTAENFNEVMTTLKSKVDGAAESFENSVPGSIAVTKQSVKDLQEKIGTELLPALQAVEKFAYGAIKGIQLMWQGLKEDFEDVKVFLTEGPAALAALQAQREREQQLAVENDVAQKQIDKFAASSRDEIAAEISRLNRVLSVKQEYLKVLEDAKAKGETFTDDQLKELGNYQSGVRMIKQELDGLFKLQDSRDQGVLGINGEKPDTSKEDEARKKALADYKALMKQLQKMQQDIRMMNMDEQDKEFEELEIKYRDLRIQAKGHKDALLMIEKLYNEEVDQLHLKWARKDFEDESKRLAEREKQQTEFFQTALQDAQKAAQRFSSILADGQKKNAADQVAAAQLALLKTPQFSPNRLALQKKLLDQEMQQELQNKELTENQKALIEEQYREKRLQAENEYYNQVVGAVLNFTQAALQVLQQFQQNKTTQENQELDRDKKVNDHKKDNLKKQLDQKRITQMDYDRQVADIDKAQEAREKQVHLQQFRREQRMNIVNALMSGAMGVQKSLAEWGMPLAIPWIALTAATTAAQIAAISKQQPPEFGGGGLLYGPSHQSRTNGMPVVDPNTGQVQALVEGGEAITNKTTMADQNAYNVTGTPSQIISQLNAMHGGVAWNPGATLVPAWQSIPPKRMDFAALNNSMRAVKMFAAGGQVGLQPSSASAGSTSQDVLPIGQLVQVIQQLQGTLDQGIIAQVGLIDFEKQTKRRQAILDDATMKG